MPFRQTPYQEFIAPVSNPREFFDSYELQKKKTKDDYLKGHVKYDTSVHDEERCIYYDGFDYNPQKPNDINYH
ncbi:hypothetical protein [Algivirga pacifica]|uniref:Uncharacterized protein n=1 Tax=Algivirga pacifica TaxID=1162670 RepID=A0ABP9CWG1_9BACT